MEDAKTRATQAIRAVTPEGPVRARTISTLGQVDTSGEGFKLFLDQDWSRRQGDAVLKTLRAAGIINTVRAAKPGAKAIYVITDDYKEEKVMIEEEATEKAEDASMASMWIVDSVYPMLDALESTWEIPTTMQVARMKARVMAHYGSEIEGKLGDAVDNILWSLALFSEGVTIEDFSLEGSNYLFSERTLKTAIALVKAAGVLEVIGGGRSLRLYRAK